MAVLCGTDSLKDVIAFPKTSAGRDLLTGAPAELGNKDLADYHLSIQEEESSSEMAEAQLNLRGSC